MKGGILAGRIRRGAIDDIMGGDRGGKGAVSQRAHHKAPAAYPALCLTTFWLAYRRILIYAGWSTRTCFKHTLVLHILANLNFDIHCCLLILPRI